MSTKISILSAQCFSRARWPEGANNSPVLALYQLAGPCFGLYPVALSSLGGIDADVANLDSLDGAAVQVDLQAGACTTCSAAFRPQGYRLKPVLRVERPSGRRVQAKACATGRAAFGLQGLQVEARATGSLWYGWGYFLASQLASASAQERPSIAQREMGQRG